MVGDFSTGTGLAGIIATFTLLGAKAVGLQEYTLFFIEMPTIFMYYFCFIWLNKQTKTFKFIPET